MPYKILLISNVSMKSSPSIRGCTGENAQKFPLTLMKLRDLVEIALIKMHLNSEPFFFTIHSRIGDLD
jgi:hypothetical protein